MQSESLIQPAERRDPVTGLSTQWYLEACAEDAMSEALRSGGKVAVVTLTVHTARAASRLEELLRTGLHRAERAAVAGFARFVVVVIHATDDAVWDLAQRAQAAVLTPVDVAVATFPEDGMTFRQLFEKTEYLPAGA